MHIDEGLHFPKESIFELYENACWNLYLEDKEVLWEAIQKSLLILTYKENEEIIGYARILGDGIFTVLIQDLIVKNTMQRRNIGFELIQYILDKYRNVRQIICCLR